MSEGSPDRRAELLREYAEENEGEALQAQVDAADARLEALIAQREASDSVVPF